MFNEFSQSSALVVEGNPLARAVLVRMLQELGFASIAQSSKPRDAMKKLEQQPYDFILCEYHFDSTEYTGQVFLEDLRQSKLLRLSSAFIMVTHETARSRVVEAVESALDSYVLKPFNFNELRTRLLETRARKEYFKYVFAEIELDQFEAAITMCETMVKSRCKYWINAARLATELCLRQGYYDKATLLFEQVTDATAVPWSKLGLARVDLEAGQTAKAERALESLIAEHPTFVDAYDVMGRAYLLRGSLDAAKATYQKAVSMTPSSITRLQKLGTLAYLQDDTKEAELVLERAYRLGSGSRVYDYQGLTLLSLLKYDNGRESKFLHTAWTVLKEQVEKYPDSFRLNALLKVNAVLAALAAKQLSVAVSGLEQLAADLKHPHFDIEMACNFLGLLVRVCEKEVNLQDQNSWATTLAERFCINKSALAILTASVRGSPMISQILEMGLESVTRMAQDALTKSVNGKQEDAVRALIEQGRATLNARILEVATLVAHRYKAKLSNFALLTAEIEQLRALNCSSGTQLGLNSAAVKRIATTSVVQLADA